MTMTTKVWGKEVQCTGKVAVDDNEDLPKGTYAEIGEHSYSGYTSMVGNFSIDKFISEYESKITQAEHSKLLYLNLEYNVTQYHDRELWEVTVHKAQFVSGGIAPIVIIGIIALIAFLVWQFRPIIMKLTGVSPLEDIMYNWGLILVIVAVVIVALFGYFAISRKGVAIGKK